jgi:hypothetical protein
MATSRLRRVRESTTREFEAKIGMAPKVVYRIYEEPISAKTPENPPHCHFPLKSIYGMNETSPLTVGGLDSTANQRMQGTSD